MKNYKYSKILPVNEKIIKTDHIHWMVFYTAGMFFLAPCFFLVVSLIGVTGRLETELFSIIFSIMAVGALLKGLIRYFTTEYALTEKRVIAKRGWIARQSTEIPLNKIASIDVHQSFWGRIIGYGTISIINNGGTSTSIYLVPSPLQFRTSIQEAIENIKKGSF